MADVIRAARRHLAAGPPDGVVRSAVRSRIVPACPGFVLAARSGPA